MSFERLLSAVIWLVLVAVAFLASPPASPDTFELIMKMTTGRLEGVNLPLFALFNLMGVYPLGLLGLLAFDGPPQRVPKWPFVVGSFALGAFALLPYLVLRAWYRERVEARHWGLRALGSRGFGVALLVAAGLLVGLFVTGDLPGFASLWRTQQFPFVMSFDFLACWLAGALLGREESVVRGQPVLAWLGLVPALGVPLVLLARRVPRVTSTGRG